LAWQYALTEGRAAVEKDWNWRIAVGLWTVGLGFSGDRRNPLEDLPGESPPVKQPGNQAAKEFSLVVGKYRATKKRVAGEGGYQLVVREVPSQSDGFSLFFGV
jgi:hypothetical protein